MELIPAGAGALVALFEERAELRFPELDAEVLREAVSEVDQAFKAAARLEAELERAREALAARQDAFLAKAQRALAYAKVFAEEDPALADRLAQVILPRGRKSVVARPEAVPIDAAAGEMPRPRKRRTAAEQSETLFAEPPAAALGAS